MKEWMDGYVNLYGELATSIQLRDSLFTLAGKKAIEKAKGGHPVICGWMVDYFFNGYESYNIEKGIKMLKTYLNDSDCLTSRRQEINKRLMGIETLVPGKIAPDFALKNSEEKLFELNAFHTDKKYILVLFWSADCNHCNETIRELYTLYQNPIMQKEMDVLAVSLDITNIEVEAWQRKIKDLSGWIHLRAKEGISSKAAEDYYILGVPMLVLIDARTREIITLPDQPEQLRNLLNF